MKRVTAAPGRLAELEQHLALYFTGFLRTASEIAEEQVRMTPHKTRELHTMYQFVNEAEVILAGTNRPLSDFGRLLHDSWEIKRTLTEKISNVSIDEIYQAGRDAGALGGKLLGAGGGGCMLFFAPPEKQKALRVRLRKLLRIPFSFSNRGSAVVFEAEGAVHPRSICIEC